MARKKSNKPYLHQASGYWCATTDGKRAYLDKDYKVACRMLRELRAKEQQQAQVSVCGLKPATHVRVKPGQGW